MSDPCFIEGADYSTTPPGVGCRAFLAAPILSARGNVSTQTIQSKTIACINYFNAWSSFLNNAGSGSTWCVSLGQNALWNTSSVLSDFVVPLLFYAFGGDPSDPSTLTPFGTWLSQNFINPNTLVYTFDQMTNRPEITSPYPFGLNYSGFTGFSGSTYVFSFDLPSQFCTPHCLGVYGGTNYGNTAPTYTDTNSVSLWIPTGPSGQQPMVSGTVTTDLSDQIDLGGKFGRLQAALIAGANFNALNWGQVGRINFNVVPQSGTFEDVNVDNIPGGADGSALPMSIGGGAAFPIAGCLLASFPFPQAFGGSASAIAFLNTFSSVVGGANWQNAYGVVATTSQALVEGAYQLVTYTLMSNMTLINPVQTGYGFGDLNTPIIIQPPPWGNFDPTIVTSAAYFPVGRLTLIVVNP